MIKNVAQENVWWHGTSFLVIYIKFNEKIMQPRFFLESNIDIQDQSNVCLTFRTADKMNLKDVVNIEKFGRLLN